MLAPRLHEDDAVARLLAQWRTDGCVRVPDVLAEADAARFLRGVRAVEYVPVNHVDTHQGFQLWRSGWVPGTGCDHVLCELGRWLWGDGLQWVATVTGIALSPAPDRELVSDRALKGSFFESYDDAGPHRAVAFQLNLTPASWPADWGGHLERLASADGPIIQRLAPAWNTLDLFDVRAPGAWRRMAVLTRHVEGFVVSGWYDLLGNAGRTLE